MTEYRIVEICPELFDVQYKGWIWWNRTERQYFHSLQEAQKALARIQRSWEWTPKVHSAAPEHRHCFIWNGDFWGSCECGEYPSREQIAKLEAKFTCEK